MHSHIENTELYSSGKLPNIIFYSKASNTQPLSCISYQQGAIDIR